MKEIMLKTKWCGDKIECAKSPEYCNKCENKDRCELLEMYIDTKCNVSKLMKEKGCIDERKCR